MFEQFQTADLVNQIQPLLLQLQERLTNPMFWLQFAIIAAVFVLARWVIAPLLLKGLGWLDAKSEHVPAFSRLIAAIRMILVPASWLMLQWSAIAVSRQLGWPNKALTIIASLLSAWLLIRLVSLLIRNRSIGKFVAMLAWSIAALNIFGLLAPLTALLDSWAFTLGEARISPLTVVKTALALWFALWLANGISALLERRLESSKAVSPSMRVLTGKLARIMLIVSAILIVLDSVGIDLTAFAVFSGALGVGLGFGLQKIFSNLVSGVILLLDRSIKPGDVISLNQTYGWINHLGARYASVITRDGIEHLIPNEELITQRVENWSFSDSFVRLKIPVTISYQSDPHQAMKLCIEAAEMVPRVQLKPEPRCLLMGFGDNALNLELRIWISDPNNGRGSVVSEVLLNVWERFQEHGIEIPYPQRDLHIRTISGALPEGMVKSAG